MKIDLQYYNKNNNINKREQFDWNVYYYWKIPLNFIIKRLENKSIDQKILGKSFF